MSSLNIKLDTLCFTWWNLQIPRYTCWSRKHTFISNAQSPPCGHYGVHTSHICFNVTWMLSHMICDCYTFVRSKGMAFHFQIERMVFRKVGLATHLNSFYLIYLFLVFLAKTAQETNAPCSCLLYPLLCFMFAFSIKKVGLNKCAPMHTISMGHFTKCNHMRQMLLTGLMNLYSAWIYSLN